MPKWEQHSEVTEKKVEDSSIQTLKVLQARFTKWATETLTKGKWVLKYWYTSKPTSQLRCFLLVISATSSSRSCKYWRRKEGKEMRCNLVSLITNFQSTWWLVKARNGAFDFESTNNTERIIWNTILAARSVIFNQAQCTPLACKDEHVYAWHQIHIFVIQLSLCKLARAKKGFRSVPANVSVQAFHTTYNGNICLPLSRSYCIFLGRLGSNRLGFCLFPVTT